MNEEMSDIVLIEFASDPTAQVADWATRYPAQAREFAYLAADRAFPAAHADDTLTQSIGLSVLREKRVAYSATFASLKSVAEAKGHTAESLAAALKLPLGLFWKLHRRLVYFETIPQALINQLAEKLDRTADELARYLRQPPQFAARASYRSDSAPQATQESFASALGNDPDTTDEMHQSWK
ncbi:hypothetical protein [Armatimonas sp.]|uniref:hypothetical protein n=1 Tax=Armatimonas sp. TaxID=1872638 RepID=UPI00286A7798|nr:hypothetical protein [Armatimonas sp.]